METYEEDDLSQCTRCEEMVGTETLVHLLDWSVCEICWGDL
jgi:formylmethanofuran dehydrogenase subunit E